MTRRLLVDRYRAEQSRLAALDRAANPVQNQMTLADGDPGTLVDAVWQVAVRKAAVEHVLTATAASEQSKGVYRAVVLEQRPLNWFFVTFQVAMNKSVFGARTEASPER